MLIEKVFGKQTIKNISEIAKVGFVKVGGFDELLSRNS